MYKLSIGCKITKQHIANQLGIDVCNVEQVGSKKLFVVRRDNYKELYSYFTKVGETCFAKDFEACWLLTTKNYTQATSRQLTEFAYMMRQQGYKVEYTDNI